MTENICFSVVQAGWGQYTAKQSSDNTFPSLASLRRLPEEGSDVQDVLIGFIVREMNL